MERFLKFLKDWGPTLASFAQLGLAVAATLHGWT